MIKRNLAALQLVIVSTRPTTWIRILAEMLLGFAFSSQKTPAEFYRFFVGFIAVGPCLLSACYILNDITDREYDKQHISRKKRPISQGLLSVGSASKLVFILFILSLAAGATLGIFFVLGLLALFAIQILYTLPGFRLKEKAPYDMGLNAAAAGMRFILGFLAGARPIAELPIFFLIFAMSLKLVLFLGHRLQSRDIEIKNKFKSTVSQLSSSQIKVLIFFLILLGSLMYGLSLIYYSLGMLMFIPPVLFGLMLMIWIMKTKQNYFLFPEENISGRVYLYISLLVFALAFFYFIKIQS